MAKAADDREREQRIRQWIREQEPKEWWLWQRSPDHGRVTVVPNMRWPYVLPDPEGDMWPGWGLIFVGRELDGKKAGDVMMSIRNDMIRRLRVGASIGEFSHDAKMLGRMLAVKFELHGRGGPYKWLWTPPVYKFCDTDKMNPAWKKFIAPHDFWIQPQVYAETGQIMQGGPLYNADGMTDNILEEARPMSLASMIADTARAEDGREALEAIHIALDSWLEHYERTGETLPREEFAWTFAEQRAALEKRMTTQCQWKMGSGRSVSCGKPATMIVRIPGSQMTTSVCGEHYRVAVGEDFETVGPVPAKTQTRECPSCAGDGVLYDRVAGGFGTTTHPCRTCKQTGRVPA